MRALAIAFALWLWPAALFAATASDSFTGTDADLGTSWTNLAGCTMQRSSDVAYPSTHGSICTEYWSLDTFTDAQFSQASLVVWEASGNDIAILLLRADTGSTAHYDFFANATGTSSEISEFDGASYSTLASDNTIAWTLNDVIKVTASTTALTMYRNGASLFGATDATLTSGRVGIGARAELGFDQVGFDNWTGGDLAGASGAKTVRIVVVQ